jgi:SNF2 family DNA or RNA helicase
VGSKQIKLVTARGELRVIGKGNRATFSPADEIFFCHVLPGDRLADAGGFTFNVDRLSQEELRDLVSHLQENEFKLNVDAATKALLEKVEQDRAVLIQATEIGRRLKRKPVHSFRIKAFRRKLMAFQVPAVNHMVGVAHAANFSVPGSGKTTIAIAAFAKFREEIGIRHLVVIGPQACFAPWEREFEACLGTANVVRITGTKAQRGKAWRNAGKAELILLNYHVASNDIGQLRDALTSIEAMLVLDESHHIKSISEGKWSRAVRSVAVLAKKRVILTGTPAPNALTDLWGQFAFLYPSENPLGTKEEFAYRLDRGGESAELETRDRLSPLFWRIRKKDLGLPRPKLTKILVKAGPVQSAIYDALALKTLRDVDKAPTELAKLRIWRRARIVRLLQAASNPSLLSRYSEEFRLPPLSASGLSVSQLIDKYSEFEVPAKIAKATDLVRSLIRERRKVVIWTAFIHNIRMLLKLLHDASPLPLYGDIPLKSSIDGDINREGIIAKFLSDRSSRVLIANPAACGESISLHEACHDAIYLDRTFNCAHFMQSKDRIHRVGLKPSDRIQYFMLMTKDSIDEVVERRLLDKQRRMQELLESDIAKVNLDYEEDVVSEEAEEEHDFVDTLAQLRRTIKHDR